MLQRRQESAGWHDWAQGKLPRRRTLRELYQSAQCRTLRHLRRCRRSARTHGNRGQSSEEPYSNYGNEMLADVEIDAVIIGDLGRVSRAGLLAGACGRQTCAL